MSKAEKFKQEHTRNCRNILQSRLHEKGLLVESYYPWITPDDARRAVEIARAEELEYIKYQLESNYLKH